MLPLIHITKVGVGFPQNENFSSSFLLLSAIELNPAQQFVKDHIYIAPLLYGLLYLIKYNLVDSPEARSKRKK